MNNLHFLPLSFFQREGDRGCEFFRASTRQRRALLGLSGQKEPRSDRIRTETYQLNGGNPRGLRRVMRENFVTFGIPEKK